MTLTKSARRTRLARLVPLALSAAAIALGTAEYPAIASADSEDFQQPFFKITPDQVGPGEDIYVVPAGKKLIVEYVSTSVAVGDTRRQPVFSLNISPTPEDPQGTSNFVPLALQSEWRDTTRFADYVGASGMKLVVPAGRTLYWQVSAIGQGTTQIVVDGVVSGELFDAP